MADSINQRKGRELDGTLLASEITDLGTGLARGITDCMVVVEEILDEIPTLIDSDKFKTHLEQLEKDAHQIQHLYEELKQKSQITDEETEPKPDIKQMFEEYLASSNEAVESINERVRVLAEQKDQDEEEKVQQKLEEARERFADQMKLYEAIVERRQRRRATKPKTEEPQQDSTPTATPTDTESLVSILEPVTESPQTESNRIDQLEVVEKFTNSIVASMKSSRRRTAVEPAVFKGEPLKYAEWVVDFDEYVEEEGLNEKEALRALKNKYLEGPARESVSGLFYQSSKEAYQEVKKKLKERYGDKFNATRLLRKKLAEWPNIAYGDGKSLQRFADLLSNCVVCMRTMKGLNILNDVEENEKLTEKLPLWMKSKWARIVRRTKKEKDEYPGFNDFTAFVVEEAEVLNEPILQKGNQSSQPKSFSSRNTRIPQKAPSTRILSTAINAGTSCVCCKKTNHTTSNCFFLERKPYEERVAFVREHRLCFGCLQGGHSSKECPQRSKCKKCLQLHPSALHNERKVKSEELTESRQYSHTSQNKETSEENKPPKGNADKDKEKQINVKATRKGATTFSMIVPVYVSAPESLANEKLIYALLDTQSDASFITNRIAAEIKCTGHKETITIATLSGQRNEERIKYPNLSIRGYSTNTKAVISPYEQSYLPCERNTIPTLDNCPDTDYLKSISQELPPDLDIPVGMLIGTDCSEALAPHDSLTGPTGQPFAIKTIFGWTLCGGRSTNSKKNVHRVATNNIPKIEDKDFDEEGEDKFSQDDLKFVKILDQGTTRESDGRVKTPLPFRDRPYLPNNFIQAKRRMQVLEKAFKKDANFKAKYSEFIAEMIEQNHAEVVPEKEPNKGEVWYIPHFAVKHPKKDKLRVVFDCSVKFNGECINNHLLQGPDHMNSLVGILLRFRRERVAICCDVQKMFYNFHVDENDRDYLRFLWYGTGNMYQEYRMRVHLFGATSSPGVATYGLRKLAADHKQISTGASQFICEDFYVDDGITSVPTENAAIDLIKGATAICSEGGLRLHKFMTNKQSVLETIPESERSFEKVNTLEKNTQRTLGLEWVVNDDTLTFTNSIQEGPQTKRGVLSAISQIFDPLGYLAPFVLTGKMLLQEITRLKLDWNDVIDEATNTKWQSWLKQLKHLPAFTVSRCIKPEDFGQQSRTEIHYFADASSKGYGACAYIRMINAEGRIHCTLMMAKARVAPIKMTTIPRLELQAAHMAAKMSVVLRKELHMEIDDEYYWSDSKIVLGYIGNDAKRFHVFVANRVQQIKNITTSSQWNHIRTSENPADIASRGTDLQSLVDSRWLEGPEFLWQTNMGGRLGEDCDINLEDNDPEIKTVKVFNSNVESKTTMTERFERFSNWRRLVRAIANLKLIIRNKNWKKQETAVHDLEEAETFVIKTIQRETFTSEMSLLETGGSILKSSTVLKLHPFLDANGVMRVGGRAQKSLALIYQEKHPAIIPKMEQINRVIISHYHTKVHHQGRTLTLAALREAGFWIVGANSAIKSLIHKCFQCNKMRRKPEEQMMGLLPKERLEPTPPFTYVGMDTFGPFLVKDKRVEIKRWGVIFTCMYARAIHIEVLQDLSTDAFLNALRCLISIRGPVNTLFCDNGTNFVGARTVLNKQGEMNSFMKENRIVFKMNTPNASHQGGIWERQIRNIRAVLNGMTATYRSRMDTATLRTAFYEVMSTINSRPLTIDSLNDPQEVVVSPNHLLTMKSRQAAAPPGEFDSEEIYGRRMWRKAQQFAEHYWKEWKTKYLSVITTRQRWQRIHRNVRPGDIVTLIEKDLPRNQWQTAIVTKIATGEDDMVRKATVRLANRSLDAAGKRTSDPIILERPIQKMVVIVRGCTD